MSTRSPKSKAAGDADVIIREFDALASEYESNRLSGWYKAHADLILPLCPKSHTSVLDIGCGSGYLLRQLLTVQPDRPAVGLDLSPKMVEQAKRLAASTGQSSLQFVNDNFESVDLEKLANRPYGLILCINALHYFADSAAALRKCYDLLQDEGSLFILERDSSRSLLTIVWDLLHRYIIRDHVQFHEKDHLLVSCRQAGFANVSERLTIKRLFWQRKFYTSVVLIECKKTP